MWCKLHREYEARIAGRYQGMLTALVHPESWKGLDDTKFAEAYLKWQGDVIQYELQRRREIEDDVKVAVVMQHAPDVVPHVGGRPPRGTDSVTYSKNTAFYVGSAGTRSHSDVFTGGAHSAQAAPESVHRTVYMLSVFAKCENAQDGRNLHSVQRT